MPRDDGSIPPVTVPVLPWKQAFKPGDRVRVIGDKNDNDGFGGDIGTVVQGGPRVTSGFHGTVVTVALDEDPDGTGWVFRPGELRPATV